MEKPKDKNEKSTIDRGLFKGASVSLRTLDRFIIGGIAVIIILIIIGYNTTNDLRVDFNSKGGTDVEYQEYKYDEPLKLPKEPTREGYEFEGWYFDEGYGKKVHDGMNVESDLTFYAKWNKKE